MRQVRRHQPLEAEVGVGRAGRGCRGQRRIGQQRSGKSAKAGSIWCRGAWAAGEVVSDTHTDYEAAQFSAATPAFNVVGVQAPGEIRHQQRPGEPLFPEERNHGDRENDVQCDDHRQAQPQLLAPKNSGVQIALRASCPAYSSNAGLASCQPQRRQTNQAATPWRCTGRSTPDRRANSAVSTAVSPRLRTNHGPGGAGQAADEGNGE